MKVALLGATGFVGAALRDEALLRGHAVTAIARHPEKLGRRDRLVAVSGDTSSIIAALKRSGIKRVLWVGGAGGQEVAPGVRVVDGPDFPDWVKPGSLATINALTQL